jgi:hypothetical protein
MFQGESGGIDAALHTEVVAIERRGMSITISVRIEGNTGKDKKAKTPFYAWTLKQYKPLAAALFPIADAKGGYLIVPTGSLKNR